MSHAARFVSFPYMRTCVRGSPIRHAFAFSVFLLGSLLIVGCQKKSPVKVIELPEPAVNSDAPNANSRIISQQVFGDVDKKSFVSALESTGDVSDWFLATLNYSGSGDAQIVGRFDAAGNMISHTAITYSARDIEPLSPWSHLPGGAIVVGAFDNDDDGLPDIGLATLLGAAGTIENQVVTSSDSSDVWFNDIAELSDSTFVAVGAEHTPSRTNPLVALIALTAAGTLEKRQQIVIPIVPGMVARDVATDRGDAFASTRRIYLSIEPQVVPPTNNAIVYAIDVNSSTLTPWSFAWGQTFTGKGAGTTERDMRVLGNSLYLVGYANDPDKGTPSNGGYWTSGFVARISLTSGDFVWAKVVAETAHHDDRFRTIPFKLALLNPGIILVGTAASYFTTSTNELFGYGWVVRMDSFDGSLLSSWTFGDSGYESGFSCSYLDGSILHAGGWTREETNGGPYQGWWSAINVSGTGASNARAELPATSMPSKDGAQRRNAKFGEDR